MSTVYCLTACLLSAVYTPLSTVHRLSTVYSAPTPPPPALSCFQGRPETAHELRTMQRVIDYMASADQAAAGAGAGAAGASGASGASGAGAMRALSCEDLGVLDMSL